MTEFYHYTCRHSAKRIGRYGTLIPSPSLAGRRVVWVTDQAQPVREALGLTSHTLNCDRMEFRYLVLDSSSVVPWKEVAVIGETPLLFAEGAQPDQWFVSFVSVPVRMDRQWRAACA